ncbi:homeobox protein [Klebsormidium nitens]|uniref:Homeobox protein n=1 Tax=Klebsormidium nitens TaxID=105231 RepID=A0A1Y1IHB1_KLENI|nr:homeobox protein [Klebsormidium nitens]|eukprot:GAQ88869.1 homeobox protein [Klebsormidium nitens]
MKLHTLLPLRCPQSKQGGTLVTAARACQAAAAMARPASASTPGASKRKREFGDAGKGKKSHKGKGKRSAEEARGGPSAAEMRKMDSPAVQRAKREIKIRRLTTDQIHALEKAFDEADGKLSHPQKVEIAKGIGLEARQVAIWFQNRRAKWRTEQVESQYDVLKAQNARLQADNDRLKKELEEARHALVVARSGIAHPTPSRMEPVAGAGGAAFFGSKDGESPGSVYEKLQNLLKSMKGKRSAFLAAAAAGESSDSGSGSSDESSEEERQPIKRAKRSALQKPRPALAAKPGPTPSRSSVAAGSGAKRDGTRRSPVGAPSKGSGADKGAGPSKAVPKGRLTRESSMGRPSTLQRRGSKLEALQLPVKMSPAVPLFADKDRAKAAVEAPTPRMGRGKPSAATPGSTPSMWLGPRQDPSPTTGPLAPGEPQPAHPLGISGDGTVALLDKVPPSAVGRGFSHLLAGAPESSPTDSTVSPSAYLLSDGKEPSPTTGALAGADAVPAKQSTPPKPSPLREESGKEARLQLAPSASDWGEALRKAEQQRSAAAAAAAPAPARLDSPDLPTDMARDFVRALGAGEAARSPSPSVLPSGRAAAAAGGRRVARGGRRGGDTAGLAARLAALDGGLSKGLDALAVLHLGAAPGAGDNKGAAERNGLLELSLEPGSGLAPSRTAQLLAEAAARVSAGSSLPSRLARGTAFLGSASAFEAFRGGGNLLDPYQDPPFSSGLREERALSPSLRDAISQHRSGHTTQALLPGEGREEAGAPGSSTGPLTPRLGPAAPIPPWLTAVASGLWGEGGSPGGRSSSPGWWTQIQSGH